MTIAKITTAIATYRDAATMADDAAKGARSALSATLVAFGTTRVSDAKVSAGLSKDDANLIGAKNPTTVRNLKRIGAEVHAGRIIVDTYDRKALSKVSGKAQNRQGWEAYFASLEDGTTVTLSALADADDLESATTKATKDWDFAKAMATLVAKAEKEGISRERFMAEAEKFPGGPVALVAVPGEAA